MKTTLVEIVLVLIYLLAVLGCEGVSDFEEKSYRNERKVADLSTANSPIPVVTGSSDATVKTPDETGEKLSLKDQSIAILSKNCSRCHGAGSTQGNFGIVDNIPAMIASAKYIIAGSPEASRIFTKLAPFGNMPPSGALKTEDVATLKQWIQAIQAVQIVPLNDFQILDSI